MSLAGPMLFDPRGFWGDEDVKLLDWTAVAVYMKLLSAQWEEGDIPEDPRRLRAILAGGLRSTVTDEDLAQVLEFFEPVGEGRLANPRLAAEREEWILKKEEMSAKNSRAGVLSGQSRRRKRDKARNARSTPVERALNESGTEGEQTGNKPGTKHEQKRTPFPSVPCPTSSPPDPEESPSGTADNGGRPLNAQALRIQRIEERFRASEVKPPKPPVLARWLKILKTEERMMSFLDDMDNRGKLGVMEYCGRVVTDWEPKGAGRRAPPGVGSGKGSTALLYTGGYDHLPEEKP